MMRGHAIKAWVIASGMLVLSWGFPGAVHAEDESKTAGQTKAVKASGASLEKKGTKGKKGKKGKRHYLDTPPCLTWIPDQEPKAAILCVHGLGLHNGTYEDFGKRMAQLGYAVYSVDVRGFGSWKAAQGRKKVSFDECLEDVHKTLKVIHKVHRSLPVFILGESMGGAIALRVTSMHPELVDGLVSSVPSGDRFKQGKTRLKVALKLLSAPNKEFDIGSQVVDQATQKEDLRERWSSDPLARMNLSPKELVQFQDFMNRNHKSVKAITGTPVLMLQGKGDKLVKPEGTISLFNAIPSPDKKLELIAGKEHLILEEGQFDDQVIKTVDDWLQAHLVKRDSGQLSRK